MRRGPVDSGWAGSLFKEPIAPGHAHATKDVPQVAVASLLNEQGDVYCNRLGAVVDRQECDKCEYLSKTGMCQWVMSVHDAELVNGKWPPTAQKAPVLQDCTDCICPHCANNGVSCHECKGPEACAKHNGKIGLCPDFRAVEGEEQDCFHNGCLCITCQRLGQDCKECVGPLRCVQPVRECEDYLPVDITDNPYAAEHSRKARTRAEIELGVHPT
jgi:hypothetical protein